MTNKTSARSERNKRSSINLASLPREEAIRRARVAGRGILRNSAAVSAVFYDIWTNWMNSNVPTACGQSEDDFGELVNLMMNEFEAGMTESIHSITADQALECVESHLVSDSFRAWHIHNVLVFMVQALPEDKEGALPIRCTLDQLRESMNGLASSLMNVIAEARRG